MRGTRRAWMNASAASASMLPQPCAAAHRHEDGRARRKHHAQAQARRKGPAPASAGKGREAPRRRGWLRAARSALRPWTRGSAQCPARGSPAQARGATNKRRLSSGCKTRGAAVATGRCPPPHALPARAGTLAVCVLTFLNSVHLVKLNCTTHGSRQPSVVLFSCSTPRAMGTDPPEGC